MAAIHWGQDRRSTDFLWPTQMPDLSAILAIQKAAQGQTLSEDKRKILFQYSERFQIIAVEPPTTRGKLKGVS